MLQLHASGRGRHGLVTQCLVPFLTRQICPPPQSSASAGILAAVGLDVPHVVGVALRVGHLLRNRASVVRTAEEGKTGAARSVDRSGGGACRGSALGDRDLPLGVAAGGRTRDSSHRRGKTDLRTSRESRSWESPTDSALRRDPHRPRLYHRCRRARASIGALPACACVTSGPVGASDAIVAGSPVGFLRSSFAPPEPLDPEVPFPLVPAVAVLVPALPSSVPPVLVSPLPAVNSFPEHEATVKTRIETAENSWAESFIGYRVYHARCR